MTDILKQLDLNETFIYQFVLFVVFFLLISQIYLKPFQKLLHQRSRKLNDEMQSSSDLIRAVENRLSDYEREIAHARQSALRSYEGVISEARAKEDAAMNAFKEEIKKEYQKAAQQLQDERSKVEAELKSQVSQYADTLAQKALGEK
jgi:F-type H+-transporting ATPase subunit b